MATVVAGQFDFWLTEKLKSASTDIDTDVFVSYIISILDTESTAEEREESITELLAGVVDPGLAVELYKSILQQWDAENANKKTETVKEDIGEKLSAMFGKQTLATVQEKKLTKEEADRKAAILAQYGQVSDGEESDSDECSENEDVPTLGAAKSDPSDLLLIRNVNKEEVQRAEREKREKAKEEQEKKKEKDKQDRVAQKQKQQERKEAEKKRTSKGEKKR
ncbi:coiled-coil domain-containing protein 43-like [Physella acuta]|uniref:coiled-coil domain-containing protein 43-like n=1 Tax=Physella acuta TaxID=109671 RepID=UPI0027DB48EF|nr:coiled-coil domain-containing protein 43-like [Physella acuta]